MRPVATGLFAPVFLDNSTSSVVNRDCDCGLHSLLIVIYTRPQPTLIYSNDVHHHPTIPPSPLGQAEQQHIIAMQTPLHRRFHPPATRIQSQNHDRLRPTVPFFMIHALPGLHGRQHRVPQASGSRGKKSREIDPKQTRIIHDDEAGREVHSAEVRYDICECVRGVAQTQAFSRSTSANKKRQKPNPCGRSLFA